MEQERELIKRCLLHDKVAERELYEQFSGRMFGICLRYCKNVKDAEDALQEGFIRIFMRLHTFRFEGAFEGWIRRIIIRTAVNTCLSQVRHGRHEDIAPLEEQIPSADDPFAKLTADELLEIIGELAPGYRTVFNLRVIDGYSHAEVGRMLGISEETSKSQLHRARRQIQAILARRTQVGLHHLPSNETVYDGR